jgi:hypothetical protein
MASGPIPCHLAHLVPPLRPNFCYWRRQVGPEHQPPLCLRNPPRSLSLWPHSSAARLTPRAVRPIPPHHMHPLASGSAWSVIESHTCVMLTGERVPHVRASFSFATTGVNVAVMAGTWKTFPSLRTGTPGDKWAFPWPVPPPCYLLAWAHFPENTPPPPPELCPQ